MYHRSHRWPTWARPASICSWAFGFVAIASACGCSTITGPAALHPNGTPPLASLGPATIRAQSDDPAAGTRDAQRTPSPDQPESGASPDPAAAQPRPSPTGGFFETVSASLLGPASTDDWTPLQLGTLFTEGWNRPFVFSPQSDGGAFRQEWINAANGVFYRQFVFDYNFRDRVSPSGDRDIGTLSVFAPLSRRFELFLAIPFVDYHLVDRSATQAGMGSRAGGSVGPSAYRATFGDITVQPQVLLSETKNTSILALLAIRTPTGSLAAGNGGTSLGPQVQFWQGLPNRWVIRGGAGPIVPVSSTGLHTTFDTNLTIGRFLTLDDVRYFKELSTWVAVSNSAVMDHRGPASDSLTILPGIRFRIAKDAWFLYGVEVPLVAPRGEDYAMYIRLVYRF